MQKKCREVLLIQPTDAVPGSNVQRHELANSAGTRPDDVLRNFDGGVHFCNNNFLYCTMLD
jgi:hypothetical protein